jgi:hypothetical protein
MTKVRNEREGDPNMLRSASDPFTIYLEESYIITSEILQIQVDTRMYRKTSWYFPTLKFVSFEQGTLKLLNSHRNVSYEMAILIEKDKLYVSCSCGLQVETICVHTFKALERIIWIGKTDYFEKYRPKGLVDMGTVHKRHFDIKKTDLGLDISPKPSLGHVFQLSDKFQGVNFKDILNYPKAVKAHNTEINVTELTYILMDSSRHKWLPFLLPCLGILNKAGTAIKGFYNFINGTGKDYDSYLTDEQKALNVICYEMWQQVKSRSGSIIKNEEPQNNFLLPIYGLWERAVSFLFKQPFIYKYYFYNKRELKRSPGKKRLRKISIGRESPQLCFQLIDKDSYYQLKLIVQINGNETRDFNSDITLFISKNQIVYLLSSLRDAAIVEWMREYGNCITIFKEHFSEFETEILNQLSSDYPVKRVSFQKRQKSGNESNI